MTFQFTVTVELERTTGKFEPKGDMSDLIREEIVNANPQDLTGPNYDGEFSITTWDVDDTTPAPAKKPRKGQKKAGV